MPRLSLQIDYTDVGPAFFAWLKNAIPPYLNVFNLQTTVYLNPQPRNRPVNKFDDGTLYNFAQSIINNSTIRQNAEANNDWFAHVLITTYHIQQHLGLMYDFGFDTENRQGCGIFAGEIQGLTGSFPDNFKRVLLRTTLHEVGHCLNLVHNNDGTLMTPTSQIMGPADWINSINYHYAAKEIQYVSDYPSQCKPGGADSNFNQIIDDNGKSSSNKIKISLHSCNDKASRTFDFGGAVSIIVKITNVSKRQVEILSPTDPNDEHCKIWITTPNNKKRRLQKAIRGCGIRTKKIQIKANDFVYFPLHIFADNSGYLFNITGKYKIKVATKQSDKTWTKPSSISISVQNPEKHTAILKKTVNSPDVLKYILLGGKKKRDVDGKLNKVISLLPDSGFSRSVHWNSVYTIKNNIASSKTQSAINKLNIELLNLYQKLLKIETSSIRKGKIIKDYQKTSKLLKQESIKITKDEKKMIMDYNTFNSRSIKIKKPVVLSPKKYKRLLLFLITVSLLNFSCVKDKVDMVSNNLVYGTLTYDNIILGNKPLAPGQTAKVFLNNTESSLNAFITTDTGKYSFMPTIKGTYTLQFFHYDSLLQFNAGLVQKMDIDTLRVSSYIPLTYSSPATSPIEIKDDNKTFQQNMNLTAMTTGLKVVVSDDKGNLLPNVRVCIYSNQAFANANTPYCGGSIAYLSTDLDGQVVFAGLQAQVYYIVARLDVGTLQLTNQWQDDQKVSDALTNGNISTKEIIIK